jgi:hypothetical protein
MVVMVVWRIGVEDKGQRGYSRMGGGGGDR